MYNQERMDPKAKEDPILLLAEKTGSSWDIISKARSNAETKRKELYEVLKGFDSSDTSIVVFGSLARDEFTSGSDIDWTLLIDGQSSPEHLNSALEIHNRIEEAKEKLPGREGTFGGLALSGELIHRIGGSDDTNRNTTQRILLLLESAAIGRTEAHERVIRNVLRRYVEEDYGVCHASGQFHVPRFLQNDISRYWRTVAVDFAYKQRQRRDQGWALRGAKLRLSRKLTYVAGLLTCFSCELQKEEILHGNGDSQLHPIVKHLSRYSQKTPLEIVAETIIALPGLESIGKELFDTYSEFLELLNDHEKREWLEKLEREQAQADEVYDQVRQLGHTFQRSLSKLFLEENGTKLFDLTKAYGVF
jgi:predicted nucleotidyltransferase